MKHFLLLPTYSLQVSFRLFALLNILYLPFISFSVLGQTPGLIVKSALAGKAVLDPNGDGYVSFSNAGFTANDQTESEIRYKRLTVQEAEPTSDLANGPSCGFTDFVDAANIDPVASYLSPSPSSNLMFRFRLGGYAPNSKGYSILIDTDNKFGNIGVNADPNYISGNPGFEVEIELVTNFGVRLYDINGKNGTTLAASDLKTTLPYADYAQKSIAFTTNCGDADYFYDFYIPFSVITTYIPTFTPSTPIRMVANTIISTQSVLKGPISDIGGIDDRKYGGNIEKAWTTLIDAAIPTPLNSIISPSSSFPPARSATPVISGPIAAGATIISGTSTEADGTVITIYVNGASVGTATVTGGTWSRTGLPALTSGAIITATATATGRSASLDSESVKVGSCSIPNIITATTASSGKNVSGTSSEPDGTIVSIFVGGALKATTTVSAGLWSVANWAGAGMNSGQIVTVSTPNCGTSANWEFCQSNNRTDPPVIGGGATILPSATSLSGTAVAGATLNLYSNGTQINTQTLAPGVTSWTFNGLSLSPGQLIFVRAIAAGTCLSDAASVTVKYQTSAPVVLGPIYTSAISVKGTSTEAAGTSIDIYNGATKIGTTSVDASGNWILNGVSGLAAGNTITATALASGKSLSASSNSVVVEATPVALPATTQIPIITGSYQEGGTSVSGTSSSPDGTIIKVYIDGVLLGTTSVLGGTWTLSGLSAFDYDLYAGGKLTATATESGRSESSHSALVTVSCAPPLDRTINALTSQICESTSAQIEVLNSEEGVIYTLRNATNTANVSTSLLGTGNTITFNSFTFTSNQTIQLQALRIPLTTCRTISPSSATVTVAPYPSTSSNVTFSPAAFGNPNRVNVENTTNGFRYQLKDNSNDASIGVPITSSANNSTVSLPTGSPSSSTTYYVLVTDATRPTNCTSRLNATYTYTPLPIELLYFRAIFSTGKAKLTWATVSEKDNSFFTVEKSTDGVEFFEIARVNSLGNSNHLQQYEALDKEPIIGISYYRLKQTDVNGKYSYSKLVSLENHVDFTFTVSPNPIQQNSIRLVFNTTNQEVYLSLSDIFGKQLYAKKHLISATGDLMIKDLGASLQKGIYIIEVLDSTQKQRTVQKILVQ